MHYGFERYQGRTSVRTLCRRDRLAISSGSGTSPYSEKKPLAPGNGDRGKSVLTAVFWGGIPSVFLDRRNLINSLFMPISRGAYKCQDCTSALRKMQR